MPKLVRLLLATFAGEQKPGELPGILQCPGEPLKPHMAKNCPGSTMLRLRKGRTVRRPRARPLDYRLRLSCQTVAPLRQGFLAQLGPGTQSGSLV